MEARDAERLTSRIQIKLNNLADTYEAVLPLIKEAYEGEAYKALGYKSHGAYVQDRFGQSLNRLGVSMRRIVVKELTEEGMSTRAIAEVVGVTPGTVNNDQTKEVGQYMKPQPKDTVQDRTVPLVSIDGRTFPQRQRPRSTPAEVERRRPLVLQLWEEKHPGPEGVEVWKRDQIATALDINHGNLREDLVALGLPTRREHNYTIRSGMPEGDLRWRDVDVINTDDSESEVKIPSFAACDTPTAPEAIESVRAELALILQGRYELSLKDRNHLIKVLENALERLQRNEIGTEDPRSEARVAG